MQIGHVTVRALLGRMEDHGATIAEQYGEPGYGDANTRGVVMGYYWCDCANGPESRSGLHSLEDHYPRLFAALEEQGYALEWSDEWMVDHDHGASRAYRCQPDSYAWQPSYLWVEDEEYFLTPEDDIEEWTDAAKNRADVCIPGRVWNAQDMREAGWTEHTAGLESGLHAGQTDDPTEVVAQIRREYGDTVDVVFLLDSVGQFDMRFSAWIRDAQTETETEDN